MYNTTWGLYHFLFQMLLRLRLPGQIDLSSPIILMLPPKGTLNFNNYKEAKGSLSPKTSLPPFAFHRLAKLRRCLGSGSPTSSRAHPYSWFHPAVPHSSSAICSHKFLVTCVRRKRDTSLLFMQRCSTTGLLIDSCLSHDICK